MSFVLPADGSTPARSPAHFPPLSTPGCCLLSSSSDAAPCAGGVESATRNTARVNLSVLLDLAVGDRSARLAPQLALTRSPKRPLFVADLGAIHLRSKSCNLAHVSAPFSF